MSLTTRDHTPQPVPRKFPRLMQHRSTGAVYLVFKRNTPPGVTEIYDAACVHHGTTVPAMPTGAVPQHQAPPPPAIRPTIGEQTPDMQLSNLQDYPNVVSMQNEA